MAIALSCAGAAAQQPVTPEDEVIAMLREWRTARAAKGDAPAVPVFSLGGDQPGPDSTPGRIRVGDRVQEMALTSNPRPVYPEEAKRQGIEGVVTLEAVIGKDGTVQSLSVISGDPLLVPPALEAVKQWEYRPTLLNGAPVEVTTQIQVNFSLRPVKGKKL
jgi:TonB family protein